MRLTNQPTVYREISTGVNDNNNNNPSATTHNHSLQHNNITCVSKIIKRPTYDNFILVLSLVFIIITVINLYVCGIITNSDNNNNNDPSFEYATDTGTLKLRHDDGVDRLYKLPSVDRWQHVEKRQSDGFKKDSQKQRYGVYPIHVNQAILDSMIPFLSPSSSSSLTSPTTTPVIVLLRPARDGDDDSSSMVLLWQTLYPWATLWVVGIIDEENDATNSSSSSSSRNNIRHLTADVTITDGIRKVVDALRDDRATPTIIVDGAGDSRREERLKELFRFVSPGGLYILEDDVRRRRRTANGKETDVDATATPLVDSITQLSRLTQSEFISGVDRYASAALVGDFEDGRWVGEVVVSPIGFLVRKKTMYERQFTERSYRFAHNLKEDREIDFLSGHYEDDMYYIMAMDPGV